GAAMTADAYHMTSTHPEGSGAVKAMELALEEAQINPEQVDYLNVHATSTPGGALSEVKAIRKAFNDPENLAVSATKSMTGHLLGAAGAIEGIICIKSINEGIVPPTINLESLDPEVPKNLNIVRNSAIEKKVRVAMS